MAEDNTGLRGNIMNQIMDLLIRDAFGSLPFYNYNDNVKVSYPFNIYRFKNTLEYCISALNLDINDIAIEIEGRKLTVKTLESNDPGRVGECLYRGMKGSHFNLEFLIPAEYDLNTIKPKLEKGLLTIEIALNEESKPRRIEIAQPIAIEGIASDK
jgi:HSP20 family molecular chaperone IbpA